MGEKIYFDSLQAKQKQYGIKISGNADKIIEEIRKHANAKGFINLEMKERKEVGKYGDTHYFVVDTWEPAPKEDDDDPFK